MLVSNYMDLLETIAKQDVAVLESKDKEYGSSWCRRGGVGAFMMAARKWDRLENQVKQHLYDVFHAIATDNRSEGILDDIRDLRRYLLLIDAYMVDQGAAGTVMVLGKTEEDSRLQGLGQVPVTALPERVQEQLHATALAKRCWEEENARNFWLNPMDDKMHAFIEDLTSEELNAMFRTYYSISPKAFALELLERFNRKNGLAHKLSDGRINHPAPFGFDAKAEEK